MGEHEKLENEDKSSVDLTVEEVITKGNNKGHPDLDRIRQVIGLPQSLEV